MLATFDTEILKNEIATAQKTIDRLEARKAAGETLGQAHADALSAAHAAVAVHTDVLLDQLAAQGEDFVAIEVGTYSLCYSLEESRWEGFTSNLSPELGHDYPATYAWHI